MRKNNINYTYMCENVTLAFFPCIYTLLKIIKYMILKKYFPGRPDRISPFPSRVRTFIRADLPLPVRIYRKACRRLKILPLRRVLGQFGRPRVIFNDLCMSLPDVHAACKGLVVCLVK